MDEVTVGLGIILSLVLSETLGVTAGGIIVPGYISIIFASTHPDYCNNISSYYCLKSYKF